MAKKAQDIIDEIDKNHLQDTMFLKIAKEYRDKNVRRTAFVAPDVLLSMLLGEKMATEVLNKKTDIKLMTSDFALYEAIGCLKKIEFKLDILKKMLRKISIVESPKIDITEKRIKHLREVATKDG